MHFTAAAVLALLPCLSMATPLALPQNAGNSGGSNQCDASTFNNGVKYQIPQAPVNDCYDLINNQVEKSKTWSISHSWARLYTDGGCAFSVRVTAGGKAGLIGGADIVDLTNDSIKDYQQSGKISCTGAYTQIVSAQGEVDCDTNEGTKVRVEWIVASSAYNPPN